VGWSGWRRIVASERVGKMVSAFQSKEIGFGMEISKDELQKSMIHQRY